MSLTAAFECFAKHFVIFLQELAVIRVLLGAFIVQLELIFESL